MKEYSHNLFLVNKHQVFNLHKESTIWHSPCCWEWKELHEVSPLSYQPNLAELVLMERGNAAACSAPHPRNIL